MTSADRIEDHQARCLPHMLTLRLLARDEAEAPLPWLATAKVIHATETILAEAQSAGREVRVATGGPARESSWACG